MCHQKPIPTLYAAFLAYITIWVYYFSNNGEGVVNE